MLTKLFVKASVAAQSYKKNEAGVTAIEYGLIAAAIAGVVAVAFGSGDTGIVGALKAAFDKIATQLRPTS
ncbi:Flp family type IVb pilin [Enterovibrio paralichthyis]|uniref:Flp family type IVb pilin n=1 Tax=Enterovibrio paralichthyis TaxID=2853805 RepID=UPI001C46BEE4|nr:Flp family type IVb pilin [Enterovibrio paralichthyis]MBV7299172.1 Flp family type IVb pilin [Enterovibrio paralichthyis]